MDRRKELKLAYKQNPLPMGVFQLKNNVNGKMLIGGSMNLPGMKNRLLFQLRMDSHPSNELQADWRSLGADAFSFDVLETIKAEEIPQEEWKKNVLALEEKWLANLEPYGEKGYNRLKQ
jgi:hypothetical protein